MTAFLNPPLTARNGNTVEVIVACRVSDPRPGKQDERSLEDQEAEHRRWIESHTDLQVRVTIVAGSGSGEWLDREEYLQLLELVESGLYDLVLTEDIGRIVRRVHGHLFAECCVDNGVRLIALNDHVDTAEPGWEDRSIFSAWHHERSNRDTSDRIKRTHRNRFEQGGCLALPTFGYRKRPGAQSDSDIEKAIECEPILKEWFRRLDEDEATYAEVADWLNESGVKTGPYCDSEQWDGRMVGRVTHHWTLKGIRYRNKRKTRRHNKSGRYKSEAAPAQDLLVRRVPHLAYFDEAYYDRVLAKVDARNSKYRRADGNGLDPRANVPKKRTRFPGQSVRCGVCGRLYVYGGHGQKTHLMCTGAREHKCWNGITFDGPDACRRLSEAIFGEIESLPAFDAEFLDMLETEIQQSDTHRLKELQDLEVEQRRNQREIDNMLDAVRRHGGSEILLGELRRLEREKASLEHRSDEVRRRPRTPVQIPTIDEVKQIAMEEFNRLAVDSHEFARLMRQLLPTFHVFPYRLCDGGHLVLRAATTFTATPLIPQAAAELHGLRERLTRQLVMDLFDPPQREEFRKRVVQMRSAGRREVEVATALGITTTAAQRAAALQRMMDSLGIDDPWLPVHEPPADYAKLRRHLNKRYVFEPLDGYPLAWPG